MNPTVRRVGKLISGLLYTLSNALARVVCEHNVNPINGMCIACGKKVRKPAKVWDGEGSI